MVVAPAVCLKKTLIGSGGHHGSVGDTDESKGVAAGLVRVLIAVVPRGFVFISTDGDHVAP